MCYDFFTSNIILSSSFELSFPFFILYIIIKILYVLVLFCNRRKDCSMFQSVMLLSAAMVAAGMDLRFGKVKNWWIVFLLSSGLAYQLKMEGWMGFSVFFCGAALPLLLLFPLFRFRMMGAGDVKLFMALGGLMGGSRILTCMAASFFLGGILSLFILLFWGNLFSRLRYFTDYIQLCVNTGKIHPYRKESMETAYFHFTIPILMAVLLCVGGVI